MNIIQHFTYMNISMGKLIIDKKLRRISKGLTFFISFFLCLNLLIICIDNPRIDPDSTLAKTIIGFEFVFLFVFFWDFLMNAIAKGAFWNSYEGIPAYFQNKWDVFNLLVLLSSAIHLFYKFGKISNVKFSYRRNWLRLYSRSQSFKNLSSFKTL